MPKVIPLRRRRVVRLGLDPALEAARRELRLDLEAFKQDRIRHEAEGWVLAAWGATLRARARALGLSGPEAGR